MINFLKFSILFAFVSCSHQLKGWRKPASDQGLSCKSSLNTLLVNRSEVLPLVESKFKAGRYTSLITVHRQSELLPKEEIQSLKEIVMDVNHSIVKDTRDLVPAREVELLLQARGQRAYFDPASKKIVATPLQYIEQQRSFFKTPWSKEIRDYEAAKKITDEASNPREKVHYTKKWANEELDDSYKGQMRIYSKSPSYSRPILAHEYGHAVMNTNMKRMNKEFKEFLEVNEEMRVFSNDKTMDNYKLKYETKYAELKKQNPDMADEEIKNFPEISKLMEEIMAYSEIKMKQQIELLNRLENSKFSNLLNDFTSYNELFADVTAVIFTEGNPKAISDALVFSKNLQDYKKMKKKPLNHLARDFSYKGNRIDKWVEEKQVHAAMAPTRYYLYQRFFKRPYYQKGKGASKIYQKIFDVILDETNFRLANPEIKLNWKEWNQRFIDLIDKETQDWR